MHLRPAILGSCLALAMAAVAFAQPRPAPAPVSAIQLHNGVNYHGVSMLIATDRADLLAGMNARSVTIQGGAWQLCAQPNYKGGCVRVSASTPDLAKIGLAKGVRSLRLAVGPQPVAGQTGPSLKGMASEFFPTPRAGGARVTACPAGGSAATCVAQQATQYCAALGYAKVRSVDVQIDKGATYLADLLCSRT